MRASIPPEIAEQLTSNAFIDSCMASFDQIDVDKSNSLEPSELAPVVVEIVGSLLVDVYGGKRQIWTLPSPLESSDI